jgi:hypothetical protein
MPKKTKNINFEGGKLKTPKQINRAFRKTISKPFEEKIIKPANKAFFEPAQNTMANMGWQLGDFTNKQILPAVVSMGIPVASQMLGVAGEEIGLPPQITSGVSKNLMKEYIPKSMQSNNKYIGMMADALESSVGSNGMSQGDAMGLQDRFIGQVGKDTGLQPKQPKNTYNPDSPYDDLIHRIVNNSTNWYDEDLDNTTGGVQLIDDINDPKYYHDKFIQEMRDYNNSLSPEDRAIIEQNSRYEENLKKTNEANINRLRNNTQPINNLDVSSNDPLFGNSNFSYDTDTIHIDKSPYQQMEGSARELLGAGLKKRRGRPKKHIVQEIEIYTKPKPPFKKFSKGVNPALSQLLEANYERNTINENKALQDMVKKQTQLLKSLGF